MTQQEHAFLRSLMFAQFRFSMTLFEILKSADLAHDSDLAPFYELMTHEASEASKEEFFAMYQQQAESCGLRLAP